jgi:hypothetical protein
MIAPTQDELWNEELELVHEDLDDSWRHGCNVTEVYFRESDNSYWQAQYQRSSDGETNGLREGIARVIEVVPVETKTTVYKPRVGAR